MVRDDHVAQLIIDIDFETGGALRLSLVETPAVEGTVADAFDIAFENRLMTRQNNCCFANDLAGRVQFDLVRALVAERPRRGDDHAVRLRSLHRNKTRTDWKTIDPTRKR